MKILKFTIIVAGLSLIGRLIGFFREALIAKELGVSYEADAVYLALTVPNIFQFVIGASLANSIIPYLEKIKISNDINLKRLYFWKVILIFFTIISFLCLIIFIFIDNFTFLLAPNLNDNAKALTEKLILAILPASILISITVIFQQILQFEEKVIASNIGQVILNSVVIIFMTFFSASNSAAFSLVIGMGFGAFLTITIQYLVLRKIGYKFLVRKKRIYNVKEVYAIAFTIMIGLLINQLYNITNRLIASSLPAGSIAALSYGEKIIQLPLGVIAQSVGIVIFPLLSIYAINKKDQQIVSIINKSTKIMLFTSIPVSIYFIFFSSEIVYLLFGRGEFDNEAIFITSKALEMFSFMLIGQSLIMVFTRVYYAIQKPKIPMYTIIVTLIINIVLSFILKEFLGHAGIALANAISMNLNAILLFSLLKFNNINLNFKINGVLIKHLINFVIFGLLTFIISSTLLINNLFIDLLLKISFLSTYFVLTLVLLKDKEVLNIISLLKRKLFRKA